MTFLIDAFGMLGAGAMLYAYAMLSLSKLAGDGPAYQLINFGGAVALMVNSAYHLAWPSAVLNLIWCGIGVFALSRLIPARRRERRRHPDVTTTRPARHRP